MDPPQPPPPFPLLPTATISAAAFPAAFQAAAPTISTAQIIVEAPHNHIAHVANATPTVTTQNLGHPPYADMIYAAITALKERDGSSKRAIAKYIERAYTGLPPTHSALLTHHLKRLKNTGLLEMVKKSYKLPRSDSTNDNNDNPATASPTQPHPVAVSASSPSGPKRGRGRPPKPKPNFFPDPISSSQPNAVPPPISPISQPVMVPVGLSISTQPNIAPAGAATLFTQSVAPSGNNFPISNANAGVAAQLQMEAKRGPGRPKKVVGQGGAMVVGKRRGRPPKGVSIGPKKSPGRPRKPKSVTANGVKKGPKRLPKSVVVPYATGGAAVLNVPRPRGRPKKGAVLTASGGVVVSAKRPGRPPKVAGVVNPTKTGARPVGRPKKAATEASQEAYGNLKTKFEFLQSRVKYAVGLLKPTITSETAITAIAAIQELEEIASVEINTPLIEEAPQQPQQPPAAQAPVIRS